MSATIGGIDHVIVLVRDLDAAETLWWSLGFRPTPRGVHSPHMGTHNTTIVLGDATYVELMAVHTPTSANAGERAFLEEREGLFGFVGKTDDARAAAKVFEAAGFGPCEALDFGRPVDLPTGPAEARFSVARPQPGAAPGAVFFVCQHHTPEAVWRPDHLDQPNGVAGLVELVGVARDLDAVAHGYARLMHGQVRRFTDAVAIGETGPALRFLTPEALRRRFGAVIEPLVGTAPALVALVFATTDPEAFRRAAGDRAVDGPAGEIMVPPGEADGVLLVVEPKLR
ncbi:MAG: VOC family protein [Pseudomonadota bacterium]